VIVPPALESKRQQGQAVFFQVYRLKTINQGIVPRRQIVVSLVQVYWKTYLSQFFYLAAILSDLESLNSGTVDRLGSFLILSNWLLDSPSDSFRISSSNCFIEASMES